MNRQEYYPTAIPDQTLWLTNFKAKLPDAANRLGFPPAQYTTIIKDASYLIYLLGSWIEPLRVFTKSCTRFIEDMQVGSGSRERPAWTEPPLPEGVEEVDAGALRRIFAFVQVLKRTPGCDTAMQRDLRLLPRPDAAEHAAPGLKITVIRGETCEEVKARFFKYKHEGVWIESRRGGQEAPWEHVGVTTASPWFDRRPLLVADQPEVREYRLRFWDKGEPNGEWTAVSRATVSP